MKIALVAPHLYLRAEFSGKVIFSPGELFVSLANELAKKGVEVHSYTCGLVKELDASVTQHTADDIYLLSELKQRDYGLDEFYSRHPLACLTIARQMQAEVIARAYSSDVDIVHVYMNEEELALSFAELAKMPVVLTHHEPYNYLLKYRSLFPKYAASRNFISISKSQRASLPQANWVGNVHHGLAPEKFQLQEKKSDYFAFLGRIIEPKGVHLAIQAALKAGVKLKIAGKHYGQTEKDDYWQNFIAPHIDGKQIEYVGFLSTTAEKQDFLGGARAMIMPSTWEEPFGLVVLEAFACGTPVIALNRGALTEIISPGVNGVVVDYEVNQDIVVANLANSMKNITELVGSPSEIRDSFTSSFTAAKMAAGYLDVYRKLIGSEARQ
jgi:glycosyltransferase involved in cell wall biosynthesis